MNEEEKDDKTERLNTITEKMKNQALLLGSFGNSIVCMFVGLMVKHGTIGVAFCRGAVFCYGVAFILLLLSHFQSTKCIHAMATKNRKEATYQWKLVGKQNNGVFYLICLGTICSLLSFYFITN